MKLKRNLFAFLIMVFILSGCVSDVSMNGTLQNTKQTTAAAIPTMQLVNRQTAQAQVQSLKANPGALSKEVKTYATAQKLNTKLVKNESIASAFQAIAEKSEADQYKPKTPSIGDGETFTPKTTLYGVDCYGCNVRPDGTGSTAAGVQLNPNLGVRQSDGSWLPGITYDGYYVIAADASIPFYSIVEISNHGLDGMGISSDEPIQCIVLDRGGAISGGHLDLYIGSEANVGAIRISNTQAVAKVLRYGG